MTAIIITLILLALNHVLEIYFQHDSFAIDLCIGLGFILYMFI